MPSSRRRGFPLLVLLTALLLTLAVSRGEDPPVRPLDNEEIVRMLVAGRSVRAVIHEIDTRPVEFDLSDDMLVELRSAGVPQEVIAAMRERQTEVDRKRPGAKPSPVVAIEAGAPLHLRLQPEPKDGKEARVLLLPDRIDDDVAKRLQLGSTDEARTLTDVAVFVACTTADHVPDQWRSKTPLGRDFVSSRRHQMLEFHPGAAPLDAKAALGWLRGLGAKQPDGKPAGYHRLELPQELAPELTPEVAHDLVIGVAVRIGDIWLELASARSEGVVVAREGKSIPITIRQKRGGSPFDVEVRFTDAPAPKPAAK
jgi:hypothetical protein